MGSRTPLPRAWIRSPVNDCWFEYSDLSHVCVAREPNEIGPLLSEVEDASKQGLFAAGFISYGAATAFDSKLTAQQSTRFPLAWFGIFRQVEKLQSLSPANDLSVNVEWHASTSTEQYFHHLGAIRDYLESGDAYLVNYTFRLRSNSEADPFALLHRITSPSPPPYSAFIETDEWAICSGSPELFFSVDGELISSRPMKGTAPRGLWFDDDVRQAHELRSSIKERAENLMVVDMVRNDLGRIANPGTVHVSELFSLERYPTLWQMTSTVQAETEASLQEIFAALFPPASVTGTPKRRAMEIISELETEPRQLYTGAIGFVHPNRQMQFNVAIRTVLVDLQASQLEYGVGGGIVWDSDPNEEFEECLIKANILEPLDSSFELIETMRWSPDTGFLLLPLHLKRLRESSVYFGFNFDAERVLQSLQELEASLASETYRVRLSLRRDGNVCFEAIFLDQKARLFADVCLSANPIESNHPMLYHKTSDRSVYERALLESGGGEDVLLFNERGEVTESTIANFAYELDGQLYTPPIECGLLPGIYRAWLIEQGQLKERAISVEDALKLPHIFLMNSVRGLQKVQLHRLAASDR